ncbi:hypothetical protein BX666DRAFT_1929810 [Dichotomocladium elegans]|nr:hypothetical protein BX666DRAFT_1929810 [Dichotomocladium elegans]
MGGITVAHHDSSDSFVASSPYSTTRRKSLAETPPATVLSSDPISQLLSATTGTEGVVEDLTGEVQSLLMRESMAWLNQPFDNANVDLSGFDAHQLSLQLEKFFSQGELTEVPSSFYDEMMFVPEDISAPISTSTTPLTSPHIPEEEIQVVEDEVERQDVTLQELSDPVSATPQPEKQIQEEQTLTTMLKRRRSSCSSSSSNSSSEDESGSSSDESDEEDESPVIPTTVANLSSRQYWSSSDESESETEALNAHHRSSRPSSPVLNHQYQSFAYMHKRQIEETLLDKITKQLQPEKLPGILTIISNDRGQQQQASDEVEIDLSCLARDQLVRLLAYVEACILEQSGGPAVDLAKYLAREKKSPQPKKVRMVVPEDDDESDHAKTPKRGQQQRSPRRRRQRGSNSATKPRSRRSRQDLTEDIFGDDDDDDDDDDDENRLLSTQQQHQIKHDGPMSMAQLTKRQVEQERSRRRSQNKQQRSPKRSKKAVRDDDPAVSSSLRMTPQEGVDSIAISRPKRRAALHKRRMMEDMFQGSDGDDSSDDEGTLIVFSNEQMDFNVKDNKTIVHAPSRPSTPEPSPAVLMVSNDALEDEEDEDEEIDIML